MYKVKPKYTNLTIKVPKGQVMGLLDEIKDKGFIQYLGLKEENAIWEIVA